MELIISEQNGWHKPIKIEKAITRLGSAPTSDVQLISPGISPIHLQIYYLEDSPSNCKVFNLGGAVPVRVGNKQQILASFEKLQIQNGSEIELGAYRIQFKFPLSATTLQETPSIQASLRFPEATLLPHKPATGWLTIKNSGVQASCQVDIDLSGLPANCMQVDPAPLLHRGGQMDVRIQLFHRKLVPAAGFHNLTITISACDSYPGEEVIINQGIYVMPVFEQSLEIIDDLSSDQPAHKPAPLAARSVRSIPQASVGSIPPSSPPPTTGLQENNRMEMDQSQDVPLAEDNLRMELEDVVVEMSPIPAGPSGLETPRLKVVRNPSDDFWEKE